MRRLDHPGDRTDQFDRARSVRGLGTDVHTLDQAAQDVQGFGAQIFSLKGARRSATGAA
ncbi:hypothetical protein [Thalassobaculum sp.]|uniref:hypothetical protein n=1 Tax=Thalassobaculum sp. TaxID=2022740 RepID=UPI0032EF4DE0